MLVVLSLIYYWNERIKELFIFYEDIGIKCVNSVNDFFVRCVFFRYYKCMCNMCIVVYGKINGYDKSDYWDVI